MVGRNPVTVEANIGEGLVAFQTQGSASDDEFAPGQHRRLAGSLHACRFDWVIQWHQDDALALAGSDGDLAGAKA